MSKKQDDDLKRMMEGFYDELEELLQEDPELLSECAQSQFPRYPKLAKRLSKMSFSEVLSRQPLYKHESAESVKQSMMMNRWMFKEPVGPTEVDYIIAKIKDAADDIGIAVIDTRHYHQPPRCENAEFIYAKSPKWQAVFNRDDGFQRFIAWARKHPRRAYRIYEKCILPTRPSQVQVIIELATCLGSSGVMEPLTSDELALLENEIHPKKT